jgi:hypothetical protein
MKKTRFFFHYNKFTGKMTVHYKGECILANDIDCQVPCETKWNKIQPHLVMRGWCTEIKIDENKKAIIV